MINYLENNIKKIEIPSECSFKDLLTNLKEEEINSLKLPLKVFITKDKNAINPLITAQKIFIIHNNEYLYYIADSEKEEKISSQIKIDNFIHEVFLQIDKEKKSYTISKYICDENYSIKHYQYYPIKNDSFKAFELDEKTAKNLTKNLLLNLEDIDSIGNIINLYDLDFIYQDINALNYLGYNPIISDDLITLSCYYKYDKTTIENTTLNFFNIVLNDTKEVVGTISFDYLESSGFSYNGNVSYEIYKRYRNKGYATRSLALLKKLLEKNKYKGDKNLYIATEEDNVISQKVILNNNGKLIYSGKVPEDDSLNYKEGIKEVKVYKIKM